MPGPTKVIKMIYKDGTQFDAATSMDTSEIHKELDNNDEDFHFITGMDNEGRIVPVKVRPAYLQTYAILPFELVQEAQLRQGGPKIVRPN